MAEYGTLARPYAKAAFEFAVENKTLDKWADTLGLLAYISMDKQVTALVANPNVSSDKLIEFFLAVAGDKVDSDMSNFVKLLAANDRLLVLPAIAEIYLDLKNEYEKTSKVHVISATPLNEKQQSQLAEKLKVKFNHEVSIDVNVDESILGGMIIESGDLVIDGSLKGKLSRLTEVLQS